MQMHMSTAYDIKYMLVFVTQPVHDCKKYSVDYIRRRRLISNQGVNNIPTHSDYRLKCWAGRQISCDMQC